MTIIDIYFSKRNWIRIYNQSNLFIKCKESVKFHSIHLIKLSFV